MYVCRDGYKPPLTRPYKGTYHVLHRANKHFTVEVEGKATKISVDRLEPAKLEAPAPSPNSNLATASSGPALPCSSHGNYAQRHTLHACHYLPIGTLTLPAFNPPGLCN